jgi:hypothetical protein
MAGELWNVACGAWAYLGMHDGSNRGCMTGRISAVDHLIAVTTQNMTFRAYLQRHIVTIDFQVTQAWALTVCEAPFPALGGENFRSFGVGLA